MTDIERLQKIIGDWEYGKEHEAEPTVALEHDDIEWIIKKVQEQNLEIIQLENILENGSFFDTAFEPIPKRTFKL